LQTFSWWNEIELLTKDMDEIIEFANTINMAVSDVELEDFDDINNIVNAFHEDEVVKSYDRELILKTEKTAWMDILSLKEGVKINGRKNKIFK